VRKGARSQGGIAAGHVRRAFMLLELRGIDPEPTYRAARLSREALAASDTKLPYSVADVVIEEVARQLGAAGLGLALAATQDESTYGLAGLIFATSPTLRLAFVRSLAYQRLWGDGDRFRFERREDGYAITFVHPGSSPVARAVIAECALAEVVAGARALVDAGLAPRALYFSHATLGADSALRDYFGVEPRFATAENAVVLAHESCEREARVPRELLRRGFEQQAQRLLAEVAERKSSISARVRRLLETSLGDGATLGSVARQLHRSTRTLQRELQSDGTSFERLLDEERRRRADNLILRGTPMKRIATLLGFADPSALVRARRRWRREARDG
jgi:AraC-like DNA-binding protein